MRRPDISTNRVLQFIFYWAEHRIGKHGLISGKRHGVLCAVEQCGGILRERSSHDSVVEPTSVRTHFFSVLFAVQSQICVRGLGLENIGVRSHAVPAG